MRAKTHDFDLNIRTVHFGHLNAFIKQYNRAADMLVSGIFPNAKEITESMAVLFAVRRHFKAWSRSNERITLVAVGDGCRPRTAALMAFNTAWTCYSVDPRMRVLEYSFKRVVLVPTAIEEFTLTSDHPVLIAAVHSHANLQAARGVIQAPHVGIVSIPCCVRQELSTPPDREYEDYGIASPERTVKVWYNS